MRELVEDIQPWAAHIAIFGAAAVVLVNALFRRRLPFLLGLNSAVLLSLAAVSIVAFAGGSILSGVYYNSYEFFHYYLGSKYHEELGYTRLYAAAVVAQDEYGRPLPPTATVRNLRSGGQIPVREVLANREEYKSHFTEERWEEFKQDVKFHRDYFKTSGGWQRMLRDNGYNPPPTFTLVGGIFASLAPTSTPWKTELLPYLDVLWTAAALLFVCWAFGHRPALLLLIFLASHYLASHYTLKGAFLRVDWLMALIIALCLLQKGYALPAGVFAAYAAMMRIFPVLFAGGAVAMLCWLLLGKMRGKVSGEDFREPIRFLAGFLITCGILFIASVLYTGGFGAWTEFFEKILRHNDNVSPWRIGFKNFFVMAYDGSPIRLDDYALQYRISQGAFLLVWFIALARLKAADAFALSFIPVFVLTSSTYYYWVLLGVPFLFFVARERHPLHVVPVLWMLAMSGLGYWLYKHYDRSFTTFFYMSAMTFGTCLLLMLYAVTRRRSSDPAETGPDDSTVVSA